MLNGEIDNLFVVSPDNLLQHLKGHAALFARASAAYTNARMQRKQIEARIYTSMKEEGRSGPTEKMIEAATWQNAEYLKAYKSEYDSEAMVDALKQKMEVMKIIGGLEMAELRQQGG